MNLGELKRDLRKHGIRVVASGTFRPLDGKNSGRSGDECVTIYFAGEEKIVFPHAPPGGIHPLVTKSGQDGEEIHPEKIKALKRSLIPGWDEE